MRIDYWSCIIKLLVHSLAEFKYQTAKYCILKVISGGQHEKYAILKVIPGGHEKYCILKFISGGQHEN